ncbi:MAG: hypothetical protein ACXVWZ_10590 [Nocardioides sp.]
MMRSVVHGLGTVVILVATAFFTLVQLAHVDQAFQQLGGRDTGHVSLVSETSTGSGSGSAPARPLHPHRHR